MWEGWTSAENADAYEKYLNHELFPQVARELSERGYRGYHVLRYNEGSEVNFVTLVWFARLEDVKAFAGENYETPLISTKAKSLLSHYQDRCQHYEVRGHSEKG